MHNIYLVYLAIFVAFILKINAMDQERNQLIKTKTAAIRELKDFKQKPHDCLIVLGKVSHQYSDCKILENS